MKHMPMLSEVEVSFVAGGMYYDMIYDTHTHIYVHIHIHNTYINIHVIYWYVYIPTYIVCFTAS